MSKIIAKELKLILVGNVGSGKTTGLQAVSENGVIGTEAKATEHEALHRKETTTVAMEYVSLIHNNTKLHLYGTPGQRRFDFMASILCHGAHGMVIMIDNAHDNPLGELDYFIQFHGERLKTLPVIVAITHYDDLNTHTNLIEYHQYLLKYGLVCPVMRVDAREKAQMLRLLERLILQIDERKQLQTQTRPVNSITAAIAS